MGPNWQEFHATNRTTTYNPAANWVMIKLYATDDSHRASGNQETHSIDWRAPFLFGHLPLTSKYRTSVFRACVFWGGPVIPPTSGGGLGCL